MRNISLQTLEASLFEVRNATIISLLARTIPEMRKTNNPYFGNVVKLSEVNGIIGNWRYQLAVNRQRVREEKNPDFEAMPRKWGHRIQGTSLVEHNRRIYLEVKVERCLSVHYEDLQGNPIPPEAIKPFLKKKGPSRQGLDREVIVRDFALENIVHITWGGAIYQIAA